MFNFIVYKGLLMNYVLKVPTKMDFYNCGWHMEEVGVIPSHKQGN